MDGAPNLNLDSTHIRVPLNVSRILFHSSENSRRIDITVTPATLVLGKIDRALSVLNFRTV